MKINMLPIYVCNINYPPELLTIVCITETVLKFSFVCHPKSVSFLQYNNDIFLISLFSQKRRRHGWQLYSPSTTIPPTSIALCPPTLLSVKPPLPQKCASPTIGCNWNQGYRLDGLYIACLEIPRPRAYECKTQDACGDVD